MQDVDQYIAQFQGTAKDNLEQLRALVFALCPQAVEHFAYGMPAYKFHKKPLIYFAAFKHHIGVYATPTSHAAFAGELSKYKCGKGSVQFPLDQPLPFHLVEAMINYKMNELNKN